MAEQPLKDLKKDLYLMLNKTEQMLELAEDAFVKNKTAALDQADELGREIKAREVRLTEALSKLGASDAAARKLLPVPSHIEKIATTLQRMNDGIRSKIRDGLLFSDKAMKETGTLFAKTRDVLKRSGEALVTAQQAATAALSADADAVIRMSESNATAHEDRLVAGECSPKSSSTYLCMLYSFEDVAAHAKAAVAKSSGA